MADSEYTPTDEEEPLLTDDRIRLFYTTSIGWAMPGAYESKPKTEARLSRSRLFLQAEFDRWLSARDVRVRAEERERCAAVADEQVQKWYPDSGRYGRVASENIAAAIRALPSTPETGETK